MIRQILNTFIKLKVLVFLCFFLSSCESDNKKNLDSLPSTFSVDGVDETSKLLKKLNEDFALGLVFSSQPDDTKSLIENSLKRSIAGINILKTNNGDIKRVELAYYELGSSLYLMEQARLIEINEELTFDVFNQVSIIVSKLARALNKDETSRVIYKYNFGDGIDPDFLALKGKDQFGDIKWATNFQIDLPKAKIQGRQGHAWMVSKAFDLSEVSEPSFTYHSALLVSSRDAELSLYEVVKRVFKTYVLLDLKPGESVEDLPKERKILIEYSADEVPKARDFHDTWLPERSLKAFKGHKVSIGFLFDTRDIEFTQYYVWDIYDFEIRGSGKLNIDPYFLSPFLSEDLGGYQTLSQVFSGPEWKSGSDGVYINSSTERTDSILMSPLIVTEDLPFNKDKKLRLEVIEEVNALSKDQAEVLISTDYTPGKAFDEKNQTWISLERFKRGSKQVFDLTDFQDKDFVLAFRFRSEIFGESWDINDIFIEAVGQRLFSLPFLSKDQNDMANITTSFIFAEDSTKSYLVEQDDDSPAWTKKPGGINISAHRGNNEPAFSGGSRLYFSSLELKGNQRNFLRLKHTVGFIRGRGPLKVQVRAHCKESDEVCNPWEDVGFSDAVLNSRIDEMTFSNWQLIDKKFYGQEIDLSFYYKAFDGNTPNWTIERFEVSSVKD